MNTQPIIEQGGKKMKYCTKCFKALDYHEPAWAWICDNKECAFFGVHQQGLDKPLERKVEGEFCSECRHCKRLLVRELRAKGLSFAQIKDIAGLKWINQVTQYLKYDPER